MKNVAALLAAVAGTTSAAPVMHVTSIVTRTCVQTSTPQEFSGVVSTGYVADTIQECQKQCQDSDCVGFTWGANKGCTTYKWITTSFDTTGPVISWWCRAQLPQDNGDTPGLDIATVSAAIADQCSYKCEATLGCYAYSWSSAARGSCSLKSDKPSTFVGPHDGSVLSGQVYKCGKPFFDMDFDSGDLGSAPGSVWTDCCAICRRTSGWGSFTWSGDNGGTCWLKTAMNLMQLVAKPGATSAMMLCGAISAGPPLCTETDTPLTFVGKTDQCGLFNSFALCREICLSTNCAAFPFDGGSNCMISDWVAMSFASIPRQRSFRCRRQLPQEHSNYVGLTIANAPANDADLCSYQCD